MKGRIEKENRAKLVMENKLEGLPEIFTAFYEWMDAREKSYTTMKNYINHVIEFMNFFTKGKRDDKFYEKVTDSNIEKYMTSIRRKIIDGEEVEIGDDIRAAKWSSLNTFFRFLSQKHYITSNPMLLTERPRVKTKHTVTYMTQKEIESVFKRILKESRPMIKNRDFCIMAMGLGTGLRVSAIVNINIEDIDFMGNSIKVIEKGRKTREVTFREDIQKHR